MNTIFLDLDGTLTDPALGIVACMQHAIRALSGPTWTDADLVRFIGPPLASSFQEIFASDDAYLNASAIRLYRERFSAIGLYENELYLGIPEALYALRARELRLFVTTSKPTAYADRIVDHFGLRSFFERVYGSELSGERSNKADLLGYVLEQEGVQRATVLMIGDRRHDVEGARTHGIATLGVLWGYGTKEELVSAKADTLVESVSELPLAVDRLVRIFSPNGDRDGARAD